MSKSQSGLSLVEAASTAAASVASTAAKVRSAACATIRALAAIKPMDGGTSDVWMIVGHCDSRDRAS
jgi:hypothetical protein